MKHLLVIIALIFSVSSINAQIIRTSDLEKYAKERYGNNWNSAASNLASKLVLDKNNSLTYTQVIECGDLTKEQLYINVNYWFTSYFNDTNSVITLNDKNAGVIIAKGYITDIAGHMGGMNAYDVSVRPLIKVDIKDKKIRVTYTVQNYDVDILSGGGILGTLSDEPPLKVQESWAIDSCYPYVQKDSHKKTSSKAFIMTNAFSNVIMDKLEEAAKNGIVGNENDNW